MTDISQDIILIGYLLQYLKKEYFLLITNFVLCLIFFEYNTTANPFIFKLIFALIIIISIISILLSFSAFSLMSDSLTLDELIHSNDKPLKPIYDINGISIIINIFIICIITIFIYFPKKTYH